MWTSLRSPGYSGRWSAAVWEDSAGRAARSLARGNAGRSTRDPLRGTDSVCRGASATLVSRSGRNGRCPASSDCPLRQREEVISLTIKKVKLWQNVKENNSVKMSRFMFLFWFLVFWWVRFLPKVQATDDQRTDDIICLYSAFSTFTLNIKVWSCVGSWKQHTAWLSGEWGCGCNL